MPNDVKEQEYKREAERMTLLPIEQQKGIIATHRDIAGDPKCLRRDRDAAQEQADRLEEHLKPSWLAFSNGDTTRQPSLTLSEGIVGRGKAFFQKACEQGLEGVVAKRLNSRYLPGKRTDAWIKIKRGGEIICAIIGFVPAGNDDFRSLILAGEVNREIRCVGSVGTGFDARLRKRLNQIAPSQAEVRAGGTVQDSWQMGRAGLIVQVSFMERTASGEFRAPVFQELYCE